MVGLGLECIDGTGGQMQQRGRAVTQTLTPRPEVAEVMRRAGHMVTLEKGVEVFTPGATTSVVPLVMEGRIRVLSTTESGAEITLYEIAPGQMCVLAAAGALTGRDYPATAITETRVTALLLPAAEFLRLFGQDQDLRRSVFDLLTGRLAALMGLVSEVAFQPLEARVAAYLGRRADPSGLVSETHEAIAAHLGTAREVVSRILKAFEERGLVELGRGKIRVTDRRELATIAQETE